MPDADPSPAAPSRWSLPAPRRAGASRASPAGPGPSQDGSARPGAEPPPAEAASPEPGQVTLTIDGKSVTVPRGTKVIEAAESVGVHIPHFCWHPGLPADGNCRMCISDIQTWNSRSQRHVPARRPAVACREDVSELMLVVTDSEEVRRARAAVMEFLLISHPVDCPICDKAGECMLQDHYMRHDLRRSELRLEKVHKPRLVPFGDRILYNAERCILCRRCTRFTEHVSGSRELGIVGRGDRSEVALRNGSSFQDPYSECVADVCPVGALTKTGFRFACRVWLLRHTDSVCGGCSRACNVVIDHDGERVIRVMPRARPEVNGYWMCDEGRDVPAEIARAKRPAVALVEGKEVASTSAPEWLGLRLASACRADPRRVAILASPWTSNEEAFLLSKLAGALGIASLDVTSGWTLGGPADAVLHTADHNPSRRGVACAGVRPGIGGLDLPGIVAACGRGEIDFLLVWGPGLLSDFEADPLALAQALGRVREVAQATDLSDEVTDLATAVLPLRSWLEADGTWTNADGHLCRFRRALPGPPQAMSGLDALALAMRAAGVETPARTIEEVRLAMGQQDAVPEPRAVADSRFEYPDRQARFRHVGGAGEV